MRILRTVADMRKWRELHPSLGFVPTMGALHAGHLSLVSRALSENAAVLVSIFVNPSQFAPHEDLDAYPRTFEEDSQKLESLAANFQGKEIAVFAPTVAEMYPSGIPLEIDKQRGTFVEVAQVGHQLEGAVRPQFFRGVATVVTKLLSSVQPTTAYFGQKDIQQCVIVRHLVADLLIPTKIVVCPIAREPSGLAMSSRNAYIDPAVRERASVLYHALEAAHLAWQHAGRVLASTELESIVRNSLASEDLIEKIEYVSVNDLKEFEHQSQAASGMALSAAVTLKNPGGPVRILDCIILGQE